MRGGTEHYHLLLGSHLCCRSLGKTESLTALNQKAHVFSLLSVTCTVAHQS